MGFWEWMGFENPRDSPKTQQPKEGLPQVTDNVRDSGQTFVFGRSNAGEQVDEKAAMQIPTVYACVRLLAESIAALPLHLYRVTDDNGNKEKARDHPLYKILYRQPNPEMTSFVFWETLMTHLLLWGNAYAQIVRDGKNTVLGLYPLLPENVEVDRDESGELYYIYHAYTDEVPGEQNKDLYFRRDEIFHWFLTDCHDEEQPRYIHCGGQVRLVLLQEWCTAQRCAGTSRRCERPEPYPG